MNIERPQVSKEVQKEVLSDLSKWLDTKFEIHKRGIAVSSHEILGIVTEEYNELMDEVRKNDLAGVESELADLAVACLIGMMSVRIFSDK